LKDESNLNIYASFLLRIHRAFSEQITGNKNRATQTQQNLSQQSTKHVAAVALIYSSLYQDTKGYDINISNIKERKNKYFLTIHSFRALFSVGSFGELYISTLDFKTHFRCAAFTYFPLQLPNFN